MASHSKGYKRGKFCTLRRKKCPCGQAYQDNCNPPPTGWDTYFFKTRRRGTKKVFEAHHLLCVACVTKFIAKKRSIIDIVKQTKWCINRKKNMYAMPLWGHTIRWYCDVETAGLKLLQRIQAASGGAPPFKDTPQHDYDHNSKKGYKRDVDEELKGLARQIDKNKSKHQVAVAQLAGKLNSMSGQFRTRLKKKGKGTHKAWRTASKLAAAGSPTGDWYEPFSMAVYGNAEARPFPSPGFDGKIADKIRTLARAMGG